MSHTYTCLCGAVTTQVDAAPELACYCHCDSCQTYGGGPGVVGGWKPERFTITKGADNLIRYESSPNKWRVSCRTCGSFIHNVLPNGLMVVPLGALKGGEPVLPTMHIFYAARRSEHWATDGLPKHTAWPA